MQWRYWYAILPVGRAKRIATVPKYTDPNGRLSFQF